MEKITQQAITELLQSEAQPAVTIYIPLEATASPPHITENQIRTKNLINKAIAELKSPAHTTGLIQELSAQRETLLANMDFWKESNRGMVICAAPGVMHMFRLPIDTEEYVAIDTVFHLAPVMALLGDAREFYLLELAQQHPKLFKGDMYGLDELSIGLPASLRQGLGIDEPNQKSENQGSASGSSMSTGSFNGRGGSRDSMDNDRMKFFHMIDRLLHDKLKQTLPMLLAGIDSEVAEFRDLTKYPKLMQAHIPGNHDDTSNQDLFEKAHSIITTELVQPEHDSVREEYERVSGANPERVAHDKASIMQAAEQGRVDKLLTQLSRHTTDTVQDKVASVLRISFPDSDMSRTLNNLAMKVWKMSGKIVNLLPSEMPNGALMVARLRY